MDLLLSILREQDAPILAISFSASFFSALLVYTFMCRLLPNRFRLITRIAAALVYSLWFNLRSPELIGTPYHYFMSAFINLWSIGIVLFLFKGKLWRKAIVYISFDVTKTLCEALAYVPIMLLQTGSESHGDWAAVAASAETDTGSRLIYTFCFLSVLLLLGTLSLKIWRRLPLQRFRLFYLILLFLPMGQRYAFALVIHPSMGDLIFSVGVNFAGDVSALYFGFAAAGVTLCLAIYTLLFYYLLSYRKRAALETELETVRRRLEREESHYQLLLERQDEFAKIRHDFNNQLVSVMRLVRMGERESAEELFASLEDELGKV